MTMTPNHAQAMRLSLKTALLGATAALVAGAGPSVALADAAAADSASGDQNNADTLSAVVVTGYRKSLAEARAIKRDSNIQVDAIVAEDIAKFPELNLAESLQRLPGVQITREAGEGRRISLRGLGPD